MGPLGRRHRPITDRNGIPVVPGQWPPGATSTGWSSNAREKVQVSVLNFALTAGHTGMPA